ncbi:FISUMP domain-containing protein [Fibrobacter sp. UBA4309]|uniref:FISUMP domain-containing protein n=1 Tax=Fibrobacter sp. UBA4309 TaxID=1946537 RepID=UPI0025C62D87|nr:FISUMP domain-containing protein [Fibrobacter sp. UBA4309]
MKLSKKLCLAASLAGALILAACGDDSSSSSEEPSKSSGLATVETFEDLVHCTKSHYGEIVFVEEEDAYFECTSEDWAEVDSATVDSLLATSSSSADADTVKSSSSVKADSSEIAEVETKKVDSVTVSGFAQKGPYASGSVVTVYGLDSLLEKTKTKFSGKVSGDSGAYSVSKIVLPSQFALVEVNGFYTSENTGKKTSGSKTTLNAVVDLSAGKNVKANVNLFTELEYARVKHLVTAEKFNVPAAKKRATKELLAVFGAKAGDDLTATSLSLADTGTAGKALLAASILLQGDLSASKFGLRLGDVGDLFASTGSLDSDTLRAALADWASKADSTDNFKSIRANVKNMKLVATVPDFESILYTFWTGVYKLGACTDSLEETIKKNENKHSDNYGVGYACTSKRWHKATALDTELGLCTAKKEGEYKEYKGGKETEYYVCRTGTWQKISATQFELKECSEKRENEYVKAKSGEYFVCSGKQWIELDSITYELKLCTEDRNNELAKTEKSGSYVCEWSDGEGAWRKATDVEAELGVCGGKEVKSDSVYKVSENSFYVCENAEWREATRQEINTYKLGVCSSKNQDTIIWTGEFYKGVGLGNIPNLEESSGGEFYRCNNNEWEESDQIHFVYGATCEGTPAKEANPTWSTDDGFFDTSKDIFIKVRFFGNKAELSEEELAHYNKLFSIGDDVYSYVICKENEWTKVTYTDFSMRKICTESSIGYKGLARGNGSDYLTDATGTKVSKAFACTEQGWKEALADSRDSSVYRIVTIGTQTWMAENLNYDYKRNDMKTLCPGDSLNGCKKYGRLYLWSAAFDSLALFSNSSAGCGTDFRSCKCEIDGDRARGVCPDGWHLPDTLEARELFKNAGANDEGINFNEVDYAMLVGKRLRAKTDWTVAEAGTDDFGFSLLPAGVYVGGKHFPTQTAFVTWRHYNDGIKVYFMEFLFFPQDSGIYGYYAYENNFQYHSDNPTEYLSVRCIKDE